MIKAEMEWTPPKEFQKGQLPRLGEPNSARSQTNTLDSLAHLILSIISTITLIVQMGKQKSTELNTFPLDQQVVDLGFKPRGRDLSPFLDTRALPPQQASFLINM